MKFLDMPSLSLSAGRLTIWRASAPQPSDSFWNADPRRPSHAQEAYVAYMMEAAYEGTLPPSWLACSFDLPAELKADAFAAALCEWTNRHESLRSRLSSPVRQVGGLHRTTLPAGAVTIHPGPAQDFADGEMLARHLETLFDGEVSPLGWPGYVCATISRAQATTVCLAADHTLIDGYSIFATAHEIRVLYAAALEHPGDDAIQPALSPTASYLDFAEAERSASDALTADHKSIVRWRQFVTRAGGRLPEFPIPVADGSGRPATQPGGYRELLDTSAAHAFDRACRAAGGDSFSGLLACLAKVSNEMTGVREFLTMVPFHTRTGPWRSSVGWYVGMAPVGFPLSENDSFGEVVRSAVLDLDGVKELAAVPMPRVMELLDQPLRDPFMVSYMDLRRTPGARDWDTWRVTTLRSRCDDPQEVCLWFFRTHNGLFVNYRHPATDAADIAVPRYVDRAKQILTSIAQAACWPAVPQSVGDIQP